MNDQLQQALATILNRSMDAVQTGVTFLQAELPDVIRQLLLWHAVRSGLVFAVSLVASALFARWAVTVWRGQDYRPRS